MILGVKDFNYVGMKAQPASILNHFSIKYIMQSETTSRMQPSSDKRIRQTERELIRLERAFNALHGKKPKLVLLNPLTSGRKISANSKAINQESQEHTRVTKKLLGLIDKYAMKHADLGRQLQLPPKMKAELRLLARRKVVNIHPELPRLVSRALTAHQRRVRLVFEAAQAVREKHRITTA